MMNFSQNDVDLSMPFYMVFPYSGGPIKNGKIIRRHKETPKFSQMPMNFTGWYFIFKTNNYTNIRPSHLLFLLEFLFLFLGQY